MFVFCMYTFHRLEPFSTSVIPQMCTHGLPTRVVSPSCFPVDLLRPSSSHPKLINSCYILLHACAENKVIRSSNNWSRCIESCESVRCSLCAQERGQHTVYRECRGCAMGWLPRPHCMFHHAHIKYQAFMVDWNASRRIIKASSDVEKSVSHSYLQRGNCCNH